MGSDLTKQLEISKLDLSIAGALPGEIRQGGGPRSFPIGCSNPVHMHHEPPGTVGQYNQIPERGTEVRSLVHDGRLGHGLKAWSEEPSESFVRCERQPQAF